MQIQSINNYSQQNNTSFGALKRVRCSGYYGQKPCSPLEDNIIKELKELAKTNKFFKDNNVNASVRAERRYGAEVILVTKPVAKNFLDRIKNLFTKPQVYVVKDNHRCPDDSSFVVAKKIRDLRKNKEEFSKVFIKN